MADNNSGNKFWEEYGKYRMAKDVFGSGGGSGGPGGGLGCLLLIGLVVAVIAYSFMIIVGIVLLLLVVYLFYKLLLLLKEWWIEGKRGRVCIVCMTLMGGGLFLGLVAAYNEGLLTDTSKYHITAYENATIQYCEEVFGNSELAEGFDGYQIIDGNVHNKKWQDKIFYAYKNDSFDNLSDEEMCRFFLNKPVQTEVYSVGTFANKGMWAQRQKISYNSVEEDIEIGDLNSRKKRDGWDSYYCMGIYCNGSLYLGIKGNTHCILYKNYEPLCIYNIETEKLVYNTDDIPESAYDASGSYPQSDFVGIWSADAENSWENREFNLAVYQYENILLYVRDIHNYVTLGANDEVETYFSALPENNSVYEKYMDVNYTLTDGKLYENFPNNSKSNIFVKTEEATQSIDELARYGSVNAWNDVTVIAERFCHLYRRRNPDIAYIKCIGKEMENGLVYKVKVKIKYYDNTVKKAVVRVVACSSGDLMVLGIQEK